MTDIIGILDIAKELLVAAGLRAKWGDDTVADIVSDSGRYVGGIACMDTRIAIVPCQCVGITPSNPKLDVEAYDLHYPNSIEDIHNHLDRIRRMR
jgi:hypothetical protein